MAQAGLHAALGYQFRRIIPYERRLFPAVIFGSILPDLDILVVAIGSLIYPILQSEQLFHRSFSHSFFTSFSSISIPSPGSFETVISPFSGWKGLEHISSRIGLGVLSNSKTGS